MGGYSLTKQCLEESQQPPRETRNNLQHRKEVEDEFPGEFSQVRVSGSQDFLLSRIIYGLTFGPRILVILVRTTRQNIVSRLREPLFTEPFVLYTQTHYARTLSSDKEFRLQAFTLLELFLSDDLL